jgi:hypothetical protein
MSGWEDDSKMSFKDVEWGTWIGLILAEDRNKLLDLVNKVVNLLVLKISWKFLTS